MLRRIRRVASPPSPCKGPQQTSRVEGNTMVQMRDGAVLVHGDVLFSAPRMNFETKQPEGVEFTLSAGGGFALLRVSNEDLAAMSQQGIAPPTAGESLAVLARPSAYAGEQRMGNVTYRYVRPVTPHDLDALAHVLGLDSVKVAA